MTQAGAPATSAAARGRSTAPPARIADAASAAGGSVDLLGYMGQPEGYRLRVGSTGPVQATLPEHFPSRRGPAGRASAGAVQRPAPTPERTAPHRDLFLRASDKPRFVWRDDLRVVRGPDSLSLQMRASQRSG